MKYQEAKAKADDYTEKRGKEAVVYKTKAGDYKWCTDWAYRRGNLCYIKASQVVYSTWEGEYGKGGQYGES